MEQGDLTLADQLAAIAESIDALETETAAIPTLRGDIASLVQAQTQIDSLQRRLRRIEGDLDQLESATLRNPIGCNAGEPAVWGFGGLSCGNIPADAIDGPLLCRAGDPAVWGFFGLTC